MFFPTPYVSVCRRFYLQQASRHWLESDVHSSSLMKLSAWWRGVCAGGRAFTQQF